jgi:hypothetical protein
MFPQSGRGMAAAEEIGPSEVFMEVPLKVCIRHDSAKGQPIAAVTPRMSEFVGTSAAKRFQVLRQN